MSTYTMYVLQITAKKCIWCLSISHEMEAQGRSQMDHFQPVSCTTGETQPRGTPEFPLTLIFSWNQPPCITAHPVMSLKVHKFFQVRRCQGTNIKPQNFSIKLSFKKLQFSVSLNTWRLGHTWGEHGFSILEKPHVVFCLGKCKADSTSFLGKQETKYGWF